MAGSISWKGTRHKSQFLGWHCARCCSRLSNMCRASTSDSNNAELSAEEEAAYEQFKQQQSASAVQNVGLRLGPGSLSHCFATAVRTACVEQTYAL